MGVLLGVDTGGTYTDAVLLDEGETRVLAKAKALTTRPDLSGGVGAAIDAVLTQAGAAPGEVAMVALSTTLATNALVEGQGGRVALVAIGFDAGDLGRDGLPEALRGDPLVAVAGGHDHAGGEAAALDLGALERALAALPEGLTGIAVAARFATRNPAHEVAARAVARRVTGLPVTCSHELSSALGGPRRALTALLNARLVGLIERLIRACEGHLAARGIRAPLMVVRGDGALMAAGVAHEKPIETILSGPAASVAGAAWLARVPLALVSDIGGTTTDVCLLRDGRPAIDPEGARVGPWRTMVEAVAIRTWGLGGDSEVHLLPGLAGELELGPKRVVPVSLLARDHPALVHRTLDAALAAERAGEESGRFVRPIWGEEMPPGLDAREAAVAGRLTGGPLPLAEAVKARPEGVALGRLVGRGLVQVSGVTPTDAAHVLGLQADFDAEAARKAVLLFARRRTGAGDRLGETAEALARRILDQVTRQTVLALLETAFAEEGWPEPEALARHRLTEAGLGRHDGLLRVGLSLGVPVVALGASAATHYPAVGERLGTRAVVPEHAEVANAVGAVVGRVSVAVEGTVTSPAPGAFVAHLPDGPRRFGDRDEALGALDAALSAEAKGRARAAGAGELELSRSRELREAEVEGSPMFVEARLRVVAQGRARLTVQ